MEPVHIQELLVDFICRNFMVEPEEIELDRSLVDQGIIDSFGLIEISSFMKNRFKITVDQPEMNRDNFGSIVKLVHFIERKMSA